MQQLQFLQKPIETIVISPTRDMPKDIFMACHRLSHYMELMIRIDENHVVWDEAVETMYSESIAHAEYMALKNNWIEVSMEIPKPFFDRVLS